MGVISFGDDAERSIAVVMGRRAMTRPQAVAYLLSIGKACDDERAEGKALLVGRRASDLERLDLAGLDANVKEEIDGG